MNCNFSVTFIKSLNESSIKPCLNILFNLNVVLFYFASDSAATRQKHSWLHNIQRRSSIFTEYNRHNRIWGHQSTGYNSGMKEGHFFFSHDLNERFGSMSVRRDYIVFKCSPSCLKAWLNGVLDGTIWSPLIRILTICASNENLETRFLIVWNIFCSWKIFIECLNAQQSKTKGVFPFERWFSRRTLARLEVSCLLTSSYKTLVSKLWSPKVNFCRIGNPLVVILDPVRVLSDLVS